MAPSPDLRRAWARRMAELCTDLPILAWCLADTHLDVLVLGNREQADELVRRLRISVARHLAPGVVLEVQRSKPVVDQSHLVSTFHYVLRQGSHHGVLTDPAHVASALPEILSLRRLCPALPMRVREHLPRLTREELLAHLPAASLDEELHPVHLASAARAAFALDSFDKSALSVRARQAAIAAGRDLGPAALARLFEVSVSTAWRASQRETNGADVRAVGLQMALQARLAGG